MGACDRALVRFPTRRVCGHDPPVNFIRTRPSPADLLARYTGLPPAPKLVLRLKSLIFLPTGKTEFLDCLARSGLRMPDRKAWSSRSVNAALDELVREE